MFGFLHSRHWKNQAKGSAKHLQIEAEGRRAYKEETVTSHRLERKHNNAFTGRSFKIIQH